MYHKPLADSQAGVPSTVQTLRFPLFDLHATGPFTDYTQAARDPVCATSSTAGTVIPRYAICGCTSDVRVHKTHFYRSRFAIGSYVVTPSTYLPEEHELLVRDGSKLGVLLVLGVNEVLDL